MTTTITVFGATGNQGGSVARSLLQNPSFRVRAITRNPNSEASRSLASSGAEIAQADGFNKDEVLAAFQGSWGAFVNLNSDDKIFKAPGGPTEFDLGKAIVDAAVQAGVKHLVFSSGPPCAEMTGGKVKMNAMEMKFKIEQYASQPGKFETVTPINAGWYLENFLAKEAAPIFGGFPYVPDEDGYLTFRVPHWGGDNQVPFLSVREDYGDIVHGIFLDPARYNGHVVHGASHLLPFEQLVADFEDATGKKSRFEPVLPSWEAFDICGIPEMEDVKLMFGFAQTTGGRYFGPEPSEIKTAAKLKKATAMALGRPKTRELLITPREWFGARFGTET
ncbi:nmrA-like family protein [Hirsutella rhossiliensis]|uniref:NmrA-like family domain-containing protein n=1 Tax=Hirsutella rhossiliensis TaxID=111463 RepID=A0A9P8SEV9_9HYPO|nr:nmrA-like family domain-containing protein [Hirsutella rhossiliensis]KAH0960228.1 nmrA-like family domain-containing protein [Hirsutella rhossiliensis]